jgi:hypothetical protein
MRIPTVCLLVSALAGCTMTYPGAYWERPGATLPQLAHEADRCYEAAIQDESPAALAVARGTVPLLPRTEPPPALWKRSPRSASLEHLDEQLRYDRCMRAAGWRPTQVTPTR